LRHGSAAAAVWSRRG
jgi:hypothetical protein